jgi:aspartyl-tRNA(Asn)/glutamyl-tRNA(Gln) amidotransferase subunit A
MSRALTLADYIRLDVTAMADGVRAGALSPVALTEAALTLAERQQPVLNCFALLDPAHARRVAAEREAEQRAGQFRGPLHGVPVAVKDTYNVPGFRTGMGSRTTELHVAADWSPLAGRVHAAGAVMVGKTTMPEFGWKAGSASPATGVTRNPWNPALTTGGSSAGSAAAVAARIVPAALGGDGGGSIRIPASFCGLFGLKPSFGRIAVHPGSVHEQLVHHGFLTRRPRDMAMMLDVGKGPDPRDPWALPDEAQSYRDAVAARPALRIGFCAAPWGIAAESGIATCLEAAMATVATQVPVCPVSLPGTWPRTAFETLWSASRAYTSGPTLERDRALLDPALVASIRKSRDLTLRDYLAAQLARRSFASELQAVFERCDILALPTLPVAPFAAEADVPPGWSEGAVLPWIEWAPFTFPFNLSGNPAASMMAGFDTAGLPVGLQLVGPRYRDDLVLQAACMVEAALALADTIPPCTQQALSG